MACWSPKGGSGTTVVSVALASLVAATSPVGALLVDLGGDVPAALGLAEPPGPGVGGWLAAGEAVPADALSRLEVAGPGGLRVLPWGQGPVGDRPPDDRSAVLLALLAADRRTVVVDCGPAGGSLGLSVARAAATSLLVVRPCYLALRRACAAAVPATGVVLVREDQRAIGREDVEAALGLPVVAEVPVTAQVARAVDAGLLASRLPRSLARSLGPLSSAGG